MVPQPGPDFTAFRRAGRPSTVCANATGHWGGIMMRIARGLTGVVILVSGTLAGLAPVAVAAEDHIVGLDTYRRTADLPYLPKHVETRQYASFDRTGGNDDYGRILRVDPDGVVIAEHQGAGEIDRIWSTHATNGNWGDISATGRITIQLDGQTVVSALFTDLVNGAVGGPFRFPLVANSEQSSGGVYVAVPMQFRSSMRITTEGNPAYYHVRYRTFADATGVQTFSPGADNAQDVLTTLQNAGTRDPKGPAPGSSTQRGSASLGPGESVELARTSGSGSLREIGLRVPQVEHPVPSQVNDDGRALAGFGASQFTASIDPANAGITITRRFDPGIGNQLANVRVDGTWVGQWTTLPKGPSRWQEQQLFVPSAVTAGKSSITVRNEFISSDWDFNEFTYWIDQSVGGVWSRADTMDVGPAHTAAEAAHSYQITGQTWAGTRSYTTPDPQQVSETGRAHWGSSRFTLAIDPANTGVRLTRRLDAGVGNQRATVLVDGVQVGQWAPNVKAAWGGFMDDSIELPASVTAGKSRITVQNTFVASDWDFNEFGYWADSHVAAGLARTDLFDVGDQASETAHSYQVTDATWSGTRTYGLVLDDSVLTGLRIRISFDGNQLVDAPAGEFFGSARGEFDVRSLMSTVGLRRDGWYKSWWPMPYRTGAVVSLYNGSSRRIGTAEWAVTSAPDPRWAIDLANGTAGYFHATSRAGATTAGQDWTALATTGRGKIVSVSQGGDAADATFLEGDERIFIDGARTPRLHGTGSEDFYNGGWYFLHGPVTNPFNGESSAETNNIWTCHERACRGLYLTMIADPVHFGSSVNFGIEHGHGNTTEANYSTTVFWYGHSSPGHTHTDSLTVGNLASEQSHLYSSPNPGAVTTLTAAYEGNDTSQVTRTSRSTTAPVSFRLSINPANQGVLLHRTSDQNTGYQRASISVDGVAVGQWLQPLANTYRRWLDDVYQLPPSVTAGKSHITVTVTPTAGSPAWNAASYQAVSIN
jgi:hypothetical protein